MKHFIDKQRFPEISPKSLFICLLSVWAIVKLLQSHFTEILDDEAYYAMYARYLDWGYFDHPPMVALFIKMGSFIKGELGTRLWAVISQIIEIILLWKIVDEKSPTKSKVLLFFGIAASIIMFQVYGFVMVPDVPLLLFVTLFLYFYKKFLEKNTFSLSLLMGISMAGMIYSKYHALLVMGLVLLSNLKLLKNKYFYCSVLITALLLLPHIAWQIDHGFPSFSYHLIDRSSGFKFFYLIEYWLNQLVVFNPVMFVLTLVILVKFRPENPFERALFFIVGGFIVFFFLTAFKGHVEPHWTITIAIPLIILFYKYCDQNVKIRKLTLRYIFPVIIIILVLSMEIAVNFFNLSFGFNGHKQLANQFSEIAHDKPILFRNSYQKPSIYTYYTGKQAVLLNDMLYRQNQYDIWNFDEAYFQKPVVMLTNKSDTLSQSHIVNGKTYWMREIESYMPISKLRVDFNLEEHDFEDGQQVEIPITITNPYPYEINFNHAELPASLNVVFAKRKDRWYSKVTLSEKIEILKPFENKNITVCFTINGKEYEKCQMGFGFAYSFGYPMFNSGYEKIKIHR
ncbi:MAG: glycosyltransferase family 39 protein [Bacteroidales bacterium]|nr:glycosyltransferase family 39 protein [Bacteroidales bacterium]